MDIEEIRKRYHNFETRHQDVPVLIKEIESLRGKLAVVEEKIKYESDVNAALSKQSQEYWQDRENAAQYNRELAARLALAEGKYQEVDIRNEALTEKLALSEAAGAESQAALAHIVYMLGSLNFDF